MNDTKTKEIETHGAKIVYPNEINSNSIRDLAKNANNLGRPKRFVLGGLLIIGGVFVVMVVANLIIGSVALAKSVENEKAIEDLEKKAVAIKEVMYDNINNFKNFQKALSELEEGVSFTFF